MCKTLQFQPRSLKENHKTTRIVGAPSLFVALEWGSMNVIVWKKGPMGSVATHDFRGLNCNRLSTSLGWHYAINDYAATWNYQYYKCIERQHFFLRATYG